jgi:tRNA modification GTPase
VRSGPVIGPLRVAVEARLGMMETATQATLIVAERQTEGIRRAATSLERALDRQREGAGAELVAFEAREALDALGELLGRRVGRQILEAIFSRFCVGK